VSHAPTFTDIPLPRSDTARRCELEWFTGHAGLAAVREDWERIARSMPRPRFMHHPDWYASCLDTLWDPSCVHFVRIRSSSRSAGILPLISTTRRVAGLPLRSLELPNHPHMLLADVLLSREEPQPTMTQILRQLRRGSPVRWDVLYLPNLLEDACAWQLARDDPHALAVRLNVARCDYLPCVPFEELSAGFSKNFRGNLRKARNKLVRLEGLTYVTARQPAELNAALLRFLDVEASGWKGTGGTGSAIKLDPAATRFYEALVRLLGAHGACEITLLLAENKCIAGQFCLVVGDTCYVLKIGYDEAYAHAAPGNMLLEHLLQRHHQEGTVKYVNLVTDAAWHANWNPQALPVLDVYLFNRSPAGLAACTLWRLFRQSRQLYHAWTRRPATAAMSNTPDTRGKNKEQADGRHKWQRPDQTPD
jgi:CelD/BcsL family acetyltransferase involved in cellulose biosynthesis